MDKLKKYLLLAFMFENLCTKTVWFAAYTTPIFYVFLVVGISMLLIGGISTESAKGRFGWMIGLSFIYIFDCFILGAEFLNRDNIIFMGAKIASFLIIATSLNHDLAFYERKGIYIYALVASVALLLGLVFPGAGQTVGFDGMERAAFGFVNSNSLGGVATIVFGIILFENSSSKMAWHKKALCALAIFIAMASGSRASIMVLAIMFFLRYKISVKTLFLATTIFIALCIVLPSLDIKVSGVSRIQETISGELGTNRDVEREAAIWMINERPLTGWGLKTENKGYAAQLTMMSSHNSYLDLAKTMGIPLAVLWFGIVSSVLIAYLRNIWRYNLPFDFFAVYACCVIFKGLFEAMFAGVHDNECNMFFISLAVLSMRLYNARHGIAKYSKSIICR